MQNFKITIQNPSLGGYAPGWYHDSYPSFGNANQAGEMLNCDLTNPASITQGPGLSTLTAGTEAGAVTTLIRSILRTPVSADLTYAIGGGKLYSLSSTAVTNAGNFPHTMVDYINQSATKDNFIQENAPTDNNGTADFIWITDYASSVYRGLITFSVSDYTGASSTVSSAKLKLYYYGKVGQDPVGRQINVYKQRRNDWVEAESTWNVYKAANNWGTAGCSNTTSDYDATLTGNTTLPAAYGWIEIDITDIVKDAIDNVSSVVNLMVKMNDETKNAGTYSEPQFYSSEYATDTTKRPKLEIIKTTSAIIGEDVVYYQGNTYYSYNGSTTGDVGRFDGTSFNDIWLSTVAGGTTLTVNPHQMIVGGNDFLYIANGRYVSSYDGTTFVNADLDLFADAVISSLVWENNQLYIGANRPNTTGSNRNYSSVFIWDGNADSWTDEIRLSGRVGGMFSKNGTVFLFYQDISYDGGYKLGYISGVSVVDIAHFKGALPAYYQVSDYKDFIIWVGSDRIYAWGGGGNDIPTRSFQLADGGYSTVGGLANPFGTPMVASNQTTSYKLAKFSGYDVNSNWKSLMFQTGKATITKMVAYFDTLTTGARCDFTLRYDRGRSNNTAGLNITSTSLNRQEFDIGQRIESDFRIEASWANGSASNPVKINKIDIYGTRQDD